MAVYVANYQLDVIATFRSSLASRWHRLWALFAIEGCLSLVIVVVALLMLAFLLVLVMVSR
jgi:putative flippase GtrA